MKLVTKEMIDVMKKRLGNLAKIDPEECKINEEKAEEAQECMASIVEAWANIQKEYDFTEE